jgi:hypothetical protein
MKPDTKDRVTREGEFYDNARLQRDGFEKTYALVAGRFTPNVADDTAEIGLELIRLRWRA